MKYYFLLLVLGVLSCKNHSANTASPKDELYDSVMAIHDKVMPEMSKIHDLKRSLKSSQDPKVNIVVLKNIKALEEADEAMMQWMAEFKVPEEEGARKTYLINEKTKIQNVSDQMYTSMAAATLLLDSLKTLKQQ